MENNLNSREKIEKFIVLGKAINSHPEFVAEIEKIYLTKPVKFQLMYNAIFQKIINTHGPFLNYELMQLEAAVCSRYDKVYDDILEEIEQKMEKLYDDSDFRLKTHWVFKNEFDIDGEDFYLFGPKLRRLLIFFSRMFHKPKISEVELYGLRFMLQKIIQKSREEMKVQDIQLSLEIQYSDDCDYIHDKEMYEVSKIICRENESFAEKFLQKYKHLLEDKV